MDNNIRYLREPEICKRSGLSRATLWRKEKEGTFPQRTRLSANAVGWLESSFLDWASDPENWINKQENNQ